MKALLLADLHLHPLPTWRMKWNTLFIKHLLATYGNELCDTDLYILGDVLELRDKVDSRVLNQLLRLIKGWRAGDVVWMSGQHDSYIPGKATLYEMQDFELQKGKVIIVDSETVKHKDNWFVPFQRRDEDYMTELAKVPDGATVMTHLPLVEIIEMYGAKNVKGISVTEFDRFKLTISGDIHGYYSFDKFHYVGAPSQRDWRDKSVEGQIGFLDEGEFTRIPTDHPRHIEVASADEIPTEGEFIIKTKRGLHITAPNVIDAVETSSVDIQSVQLQTEGTVDEQLEHYMDKNKPPVSKEQALTYAKDILKE